MTEFLYFALLGLAVGGLYALSAQGLILVYRGSGTVNMSQGALVMLGAFSYYEFTEKQHLAVWSAAVSAIALTAATSLAFYFLVMKRLRGTSALMRFTATLALFVGLQGIGSVRYGSYLYTIPSRLPQNIVDLGDGLRISSDRLILLGITSLIAVVLFGVYRWTRFGISTSAVAENELAAAATGLSPDLIAAANWTLGGGLAAVAGILIAPVTGMSVNLMTTILVASLAAALFGGFTSFPLTLVGGLVLGVAQAELGLYTTYPGVPEAAPFLLIVVVLVLRGRSLPLRDFLLERRPAVGSGRVNWLGVVVGCGLFIALDAQLGPIWTDALTVTFTTAIVLLSIVVLTGYTGQISLAQWAIAGSGAYVCGRLVAVEGWPFEVALVAGTLAAVLLGVLFALPAIRTRGINLAILTLGLGFAIEQVIFNNGSLTGGTSGTVVGSQTFFGISIDTTVHSARYAFVCFAFFVICALGVTNLRRGRAGRRLLAVRANERGAASLGIDVRLAKLFSFAVASGIAGLGGIFVAFSSPAILFYNFENSYSIMLLAFAVIGSVGWIGGSLFGGTLAVGSIGTTLVQQVWSRAPSYMPLISGVMLLTIILTNPDGLARELARGDRGRGGIIGDLVHPSRVIARHARRLMPHVRALVPKTVLLRQPNARETRLPTPRQSLGPASNSVVQRKTLSIDTLSVAYGSVTAVAGVSLTVEPGRIVGLIGPNGAGKTSLIDAASGFVAPSDGRVILGDIDVTKWSASRRARAGLGRSFQGLELFDELTVRENLQAAYEAQDLGAYISDLFYPRVTAMPRDVLETVEECGLGDHLDEPVVNLSYGTRQLVAVARTMSRNASIVMLDEPAAGLSATEGQELSRLCRFFADTRDIGIMVVEHDVAFVMEICDEVIVLNFGACIARGRPDDVRQDPAVQTAYLGTTEASARRSHRSPAETVAAEPERGR